MLSPEPGAPPYRVSRLCMEMLADAGLVVSAFITEPFPAPEAHNRSAEVAIDAPGWQSGTGTLMRRAD